MKRKKSIFKNLLIRDIIYIQRKALCMSQIKLGDYKLVGIEVKGYWYSPTGSVWSFF